MRALAAVFDHPMMSAARDHAGVVAFHLRYFGLPECVKEKLTTIDRDLRWLARNAYACPTATQAARARRGRGHRDEDAATIMERAYEALRALDRGGRQRARGEA